MNFLIFLIILIYGLGQAGAVVAAPAPRFEAEPLTFLRVLVPQTTGS